MRLLILFLLTLSFLAGCGKNNTSGKNGIGNVFGSGVGVGSVGGNQAINVIMQENPCTTGLPRAAIAIPLNMAVASGFYLGVTSEGDVATVTSNGGRGVFTAYICGRPGPSGQGQLLGNPVINRSYYCAVNEITAASMVLPSGFKLNFRAIQYGRGSSLCRH